MIRACARPSKGSAVSGRLVSPTPSASSLHTRRRRHIGNHRFLCTPRSSPAETEPECPEPDDRAGSTGNPTGFAACSATATALIPPPVRPLRRVCRFAPTLDVTPLSSAGACVHAGECDRLRPPSTASSRTPVDRTANGVYARIASADDRFVARDTATPTHSTVSIAFISTSLRSRLVGNRGWKCVGVHDGEP